MGPETGTCPRCGSRPGADTSWRRTPEEWQHSCPELPPQAGHLPIDPNACPHCGATPGNLHTPECKRPRPPEPPEPADVRRDAFEEAAALLEAMARHYWQPDYSSVIDALERAAREIRALKDGQ
jgi:hypothetical protein